MGQISVAKQGRSRQVAVLRHMVLLQKSTYAVRRLLRDLKQIESCTIPTVGVSARPLENQIMTWHANIRGPENTPYHGAVFHLEIKFPDNYPHNPPTVTLLTPLPEHPNVFSSGTSLCLDMLQTAASHREYEGWSSAYSVESILLQLQSFLFELPHDLEAQLPQIRQRVQTTNQFVCSNPGCRHKGPISAWPEFNKKETSVESFIMVENYAERRQKETCCFHSRLSIQEASLGVGISISRLPRTGEIRSISSTLDLLSIKSYIKDSVRKSVGNVKFTHWFPLYLGHMRQKYVHLGKNAFSMICENTTRKFEEGQILRVIPKLIVTLVVEMMQDATHTSLKALRMLIYFVRYFSLMIEEFPQVGKEVDRRIKSFKDSQENRNKDNCPSMGDLLTYVTVSGQYAFRDVLHEYLQESLDRQVFWMLRDVPELGEVEDEKKDDKGQEEKKQKKKLNEFDEKRDEVAFKTTIVSNHILLFFQAFNQKVIQSYGQNKKQKNIPALLKQLDANYCQISDKEQDKLQGICEEIRKVKSFAQFFAWLGLPQMSKPVLTEKLKQAVRNSLRKKYHGDDDTVLVLPSVPDMITSHMAKYKSYSDFWDGKQFTKTNDNDTEWLNAIVEREQWVRDLVQAGDVFSPETIGQMSDHRAITHFQAKNDKNNKDPKFQAIYNEHFYGDTHKLMNHSNIKTYKGYTWKQIFLKIDFQAFLLSFAYNPDFKKLYNYLQVVGPHLKSIMLPLLPKQLIKSGYYYLMVILSELKSLESLHIYAPYDQATFTIQGIKYLVKGLTNFAQKGGSLQKISFNSLQVTNAQVFYEKFNHIMRIVGQNLRCLQIRDVTVSRPLAQSIGKMLSDSKKLTQLDLRDCRIGMNEIKEIADGLMRAKQIETIKLSGNPQMSYGVNNILYNLAFSPKISHIDISNIEVNQRYDQTAEALYKLIKITGSLQTLILNGSNVITSLKYEFWKALGENVTLKNLLIDTKVGTRITDLGIIGKFLAMNAFKKGQLQVLSLKNAIDNRSKFLQFFNSMKISKQQHEQEYGDSSVAGKMEGEDLIQELNCNLKELYLSNGRFSVNFNLASWLKWPDRKPHQLVEFIEKSGIRRLEMSNAGLNKSDADLLGLMLENQHCALKSLNLKDNNFQKEGTKILAKNLVKANGKLQSIDISSNKMGVSGAKAIAHMLQNDSHIKFLSLYNNNVDVDGARAIRDALSKNKTLEHLDVGFNRLRKKGIAAISDGIFNNTGTNIRSLGLKYNFISDDSFEYIIKKFQGSGVPLTRLFIKNNFLSELALTRMRQNFILPKQNEKEEDKEQTFSGALSIDAFDKVKFLDADRLGKTIWVSPLTQSLTAGSLKKFFEEKECGIVSDVRIRNGPKIQGKPQGNRYAFVEFTDPTSVLRALKLASKKKSIVQGVRLRIYKAGTRTVNLVKPKKSKKQENIKVARFGGKTFNTRKGRK